MNENNKHQRFTFANSLSASLGRLALTTAIGALCVVLVYRIQISNGFSILGGDHFDSVISASILEHWHRVYSGDVWWTNVQYFYPFKDTIAQTDAYYLLSIPYEFLRLGGVGPLLAQELTGAVFRFAGFVFFYLLCKRSFRFKYGASLFGAAFFTTVAASSSFIYRLQFDSLAIAPLLVMLILSAVSAVKNGSTRSFAIWGCLASVLYALWCLTCIYLAWFFAYFALIFIVIYGVAFRSKTKVICVGVLQQWRASLLIVAVGVVVLLPTLYVFLAKAAEVGVRSWSDASKNLIMPTAIVLMRPGSVGASLVDQIAGSFIRLSDSVGEYARIGYSPILIFSMFAVLFVPMRTNFVDREYLSGRHAKVLVVAIAFCTASAVSVDGHSLWWFVFAGIPGAKALNVVSSILIFLAFPSAVVVAWLTCRSNLSGVFLVIWALGFIALEVNTPYVNLNRRQELALLSVPKPPIYCRSFYVGPLPEQHFLNEGTQWIEGVYPHNVAALYIAQIVGIPTINGFASFTPPGWDFAFPGRSDYEDRVATYVQTHNLRDVCRLDLENKSWARKF